jgi:hypothetical protein
MPGPLPKYPIQLTLEQAVHLQYLSTCYTAPFADVQRARMLLRPSAAPLAQCGDRPPGGLLCQYGQALATARAADRPRA